MLLPTCALYTLFPLPPMPFPLLFASEEIPVEKPRPAGWCLPRQPRAKGWSFFRALPEGGSPPSASTITLPWGLLLHQPFSMSLNFKRRRSPSWSFLSNSSITFLPFLFPLPKITKQLGHSWNPKGVLLNVYTHGCPVFQDYTGAKRRMK